MIKKFDGSDYDHEKDFKRLDNQMIQIRDLMLDGEWRTLKEIEIATGFLTASISAQLRNLRKNRFGLFIVNKKRRSAGCWEYQVYRSIFGEPHMNRYAVYDGPDWITDVFADNEFEAISKVDGATRAVLVYSG